MNVCHELHHGFQYLPAGFDVTRYFETPELSSLLTQSNAVPVSDIRILHFQVSEDSFHLVITGVLRDVADRRRYFSLFRIWPGLFLLPQIFPESLFLVFLLYDFYFQIC